MFFWALACLFLAGCATNTTQKPTRPKEIVIIEKSPSINQGEPIQNADMAIDLSELALTQKGIDCRNLALGVSFFEDVYRVTFRPKDASSGSPSYRVEINAKTSEIISAVRIEN